MLATPACLSIGEEAGRSLRAIVNGLLLPAAVAWSPDGQSVLVWDRVDGREGLVRLDLDGSRRVLIAGIGVFPAYSPDGRRIAVSMPATEDLGEDLSSGAGFETDLWLMNADGSDPRCIELDASMSVWSPDGRWLAFEVDREEPAIALLRPDTGERRRLGPGVFPAWSPDGARLACTVAGEAEGEQRIVLVEADGSGRRELTSGWLPSWSRDGDWLVFEDSDDDAKAGQSIFVIGADGSDRRRLGPGFHPSWSPVEDRVLFYRAADDALVSATSDGTDERVLASPAGPGRWSPDGTRVIFVGPSGLALVGAEGGQVRELRWDLLAHLPFIAD